MSKSIANITEPITTAILGASAAGFATYSYTNAQQRASSVHLMVASITAATILLTQTVINPAISSAFSLNNKFVNGALIETHNRDLMKTATGNQEATTTAVANKVSLAGAGNRMMEQVYPQDEFIRPHRDYSGHSHGRRRSHRPYRSHFARRPRHYNRHH